MISSRAINKHFKFSIKDFCSAYDQIRRKSLMENFIFCVLKDWERLTHLKKATMNDKENLSRNIRANVFRNKVCRCKRKIVKLIKFLLV